MPVRWPAAILVAAGLLTVAAGTAGLLLSRHPTPAMRPPPLGVATVPAPTGRIAQVPQAQWLLWPEPTARPPARSVSAPRVAVSVPRTARGPVAKPVALTIPLIGVKTPLVMLHLAADGTLQVPSVTSVAGWFTGSPRPGSTGPAVIVGHVDSVSGPGVFFRLSELRPGDRVYVTRADGTIAEFRVTSVQAYLKAGFPTEAVYGPTPDPELRLITCGGAFDYQTGHYLSNIIVYGTEVG